MSVYKHKTKRLWRYDFQVASERYTSRWYDSQREATEAEAERRARVLTGLSGAWPTFSALAVEWQEHRASRGVSKHTMAQSFQQFSKWLSPIANRPPADITPLELQRLFDRTAAETSPANANALRRQVGACFGFAERLGNLARNPAKLTRPYIEPQRIAADIDAISTAHLRAVIVAAPPWLARLITVQALTGARWVEIARLRPGDCHLEAMPPFAMLTHYKGGERSRRRILPAAAVTALVEQMREAGAYVWPGKPATKHVGYSWCLTHLQRACDRAGVNAGIGRRNLLDDLITRPEVRPQTQQRRPVLADGAASLRTGTDMSVLDAPWPVKAGESPGRGLGLEAVAVDLLVPLGTPLEIFDSVPTIPPAPVFADTRAGRRRRVLYLAAIGKTTAEIAADVGLSVHVVRDMLAAAGVRAARAKRTNAGRLPRVPADARLEIARRIADGESSTTVARDHGVSPWGAILIARESGVRPSNQKRRAAATIARCIATYLARPAGRLVAAYSERCEAVTYTMCDRSAKVAPRVHRVRDGVRVRVYLPVTASQPCSSSERRYYHAQILGGCVAIVGLPDGEVFVFEPRPYTSGLSLPALPEHRDTWRERATTFRVQP